jgi:UTP--glucose-1-phosphate uridylyltransferase
MKEVKKVIMPLAGLGTRFLPLSKIIPKEVWPIIDKPAVQYLVQEAKASGIEQIIFIVNSKKNIILDYFKDSPTLKKLLKTRKKDHLIKELEALKEILKDISFSRAVQEKPLGDGHAILQGAKFLKDEPCGVMFGDDLVEAKTPCLLQLKNIFKTAQKPVIALSKVRKEKISSYGIVRVEKITKRVYKIKEIVEKPLPENAPSDLGIVGKYILTPEVFEYLKGAKPNKTGEIILADVFLKMLKEGKSIYGYEFEGKWLEAGRKLDWLKTHFYLSLKDPLFGPELEKFLKENKLI